MNLTIGQFMKLDWYLEMCLHHDGEESVYLRVPTIWDSVKKQWTGFVKTPDTNRLIYAIGKDSVELQDNFSKKFSDVFHESPEISQELFSMFKPKKYWEGE